MGTDTGGSGFAFQQCPRPRQASQTFPPRTAPTQLCVAGYCLCYCGPLHRAYAPEGLRTCEPLPPALPNLESRLYSLVKLWGGCQVSYTVCEVWVPFLDSFW